MRLPCTTNTDKMLPGEEPKVRKMAMSRRLSFTTMTMVDTMLKAATATINDRITNKMRLVMAMERKKFTCSLVQSWISTPPPIAMAAARDSRGAAYMSLSLRRIPVASSSHAQQLCSVLHRHDRDAPVDIRTCRPKECR